MTLLFEIWTVCFLLTLRRRWNFKTFALIFTNWRKYGCDWTSKRCYSGRRQRKTVTMTFLQKLIWNYTEGPHYTRNRDHYPCGDVAGRRIKGKDYPTLYCPPSLPSVPLGTSITPCTVIHIVYHIPRTTLCNLLWTVAWFVCDQTRCHMFLSSNTHVEGRLERYRTHDNLSSALWGDFKTDRPLFQSSVVVVSGLAIPAPPWLPMTRDR